MTTGLLKISKLRFNLNRTRQTGACGTTTKNNQQSNFPFFIRVRTRNSIHRKTQLFLLFSVLLKFFCKKKPWSAELDSFFQTDQRPPVRSYTSQLSLWFSTGLRARDLMGHIIILIMGFHPDVEESDSRVFNHSLMWWSKLNLHKPRLLWTHCNESCYILQNNDELTTGEIHFPSTSLTSTTQQDI